MLTIVDVSHWNGAHLDWAAAVKSGGLAGALVKLTQGVRGTDPLGALHISHAHSAGVPLLGAYHFGDASGDPKIQAKHFLEVAVQAFDGDLTNRRLMLDLERNAGATMSIKDAEVFVQVIYDDTARWPALYMGKYGPYGDGRDLPSDILSNCDLVIPAYGEHAKLDPILPPGFEVPTSDDVAVDGGFVRLWQFTDGKIHGHTFPGLGKVDQSMPIGFTALDELAAWWVR